MSGRKGLRDRQHRHDPTYLRAKRENFAARAVYKLEDIDKKFRILRPKSRVLDLGCWPGSWLQYASSRVGDEGLLVGIDLKEVELSLPQCVHTIVGDVYKLRPTKLRERYTSFDVTVSDMAPNTTGIRDCDTWHSEELFLRSLEIGCEVMRPGGHFVAKVFQGDRFYQLIEAVRHRFQLAHAFRSPHTRKASREQYIIGQGLRRRCAGLPQELIDGALDRAQPQRSGHPDGSPASSLS